VINLIQISGLNDLEDVLAASGQTGGGILITTGQNTSIFLENVNRADLSEDDFAF